MGWGYWNAFPPYVSKAEKLRRAEKAKAALAKKGIKLEPVTVNSRDISRTWWGKAWAQNLERYADYSNRIPRGRTYVRCGAVLDLKICTNTITAFVSGSRSQPYKIEIGIKSLDKHVEKALMEKSKASLDSMRSLLSGEFPADLKDEFFKQGSGLFPSPKEISLDCSCPDYAEMCKHVAAALYGTAVRLDEKPELFFALRGIEINDFVGKIVTREKEKMLKKAKAKSERTLEAGDKELSELFGIEMDNVGRKLRVPIDKRSADNKITTRNRRAGKQKVKGQPRKTTHTSKAVRPPAKRRRKTGKPR